MWKSVTLINGHLEMWLQSKTKKPNELGGIGSLIFDPPLQHDYEAGVEVRSLLSTEVMEEVDGRLAVTAVDSNGQIYPLTRNHYDNNFVRVNFSYCEAFCPLERSRKEDIFKELHGSPGFGAGVSATQHETTNLAGLTPRQETQQHANPQSRLGTTPRILLED